MEIWQSPVLILVSHQFLVLCVQCALVVNIKIYRCNGRKNRSHEYLCYSNCHIDDKISTASAEQTGNESKAMHVFNIVLQYVFICLCFFFLIRYLLSLCYSLTVCKMCMSYTAK